MTRQVNFNGQLLRRPGAYSKIDTQQMTPKRGAGARFCGIVGEARGGEPQVPLYFTDPETARDVLKEGTLLRGVLAAFNPSGEAILPGAGTVVAVRTNPATVAILALDDSGAADVLDLTSKNYGLDENYIRVKVEDGTNVVTYPGVKKITFEDAKYTPGEYEVHDDLGKALTLEYTGAGSAAALTITVTAGAAVTFAAVVTGTSDDFSIDLTDERYNTLSELASHLNTLTGWVATVNGRAAMACSGFDAASSVDVKTAAAHFPAILEECKYYINANSEYVTAELEATTTVNPPVNVAWTNLAGAVEGTVDTTAWQNGIDALKKESSVVGVSICSGSNTHIALAKAHVAWMSNRGRSERIGYYGAAEGVTAAATILANAALINDRKAVYVAPGVKSQDPATGLFTTLPGWLVACMINGAKVGAEVNTNLTHLTINGADLELEYTPDEHDTFITGGVMTLERVSGRGIRIVRDLTTFTGDDNPANISLMNVDLGNQMSRDLREMLEEVYIRNGRSTFAAADSIKTSVESYLDEKVLAEWINEWRAVNVRITEGAAWITFEVSPVTGLYWILINANFYPSEIIV